MDKAVLAFKKRRDERVKRREDAFTERARDENGRFASTGNKKPVPANKLPKVEQITNKAVRIRPKRVHKDAFEESVHPRDENGRFSSSGGAKRAMKMADFKHVEKADRQKMLDDAPSGSEIKGIYVKSGRKKGMPVKIQKRSNGHWYINGERNSEVNSIIRNVLEGTDKDYELN